MGEAVPTIYDWAGSKEAFVRWLNRFYDLIEVEAPDIVAMFGGRVSEEHRAHVTDWWTEVNSQPGAQTVAHAPVPRWGWGVAPPYQPAGSSDS